MMSGSAMKFMVLSQPIHFIVTAMNSIPVSTAIAGMTSIPVEMFEATGIDGSSRLHILLQIIFSFGNAYDRKSAFSLVLFAVSVTISDIICFFLIRGKHESTINCLIRKEILTKSKFAASKSGNWLSKVCYKTYLWIPVGFPQFGQNLSPLPV